MGSWATKTLHFYRPSSFFPTGSREITKPTKNFFFSFAYSLYSIFTLRSLYPLTLALTFALCPRGIFFFFVYLGETSKMILLRALLCERSNASGTFLQLVGVGVFWSFFGLKGQSELFTFGLSSFSKHYHMSWIYGSNLFTELDPCASYNRFCRFDSDIFLGSDPESRSLMNNWIAFTWDTFVHIGT